MYFDKLNTFICSIKGVFILTEKQEAIVECLAEDFLMPTKAIIKKIELDWAGSIKVSERQVQQIRKTIIDGLNETLTIRKGENQMGDVIHGLDAVQLDIINKVNEGKGNEWWSIDELATELEVTQKAIVETLIEFHFMITGQLWDEDTQDYLDLTKLSEIAHEFTGDLASDDSPVFDTAEVDSVETASAPAAGTSAAPAGGNEFWEVKIDCVTACSKVEQQIDVFMSKLSRKKAMMFMKWSGACEWLAYLVGEKKEDGYHIEDLYIPDQRASATLVDKVQADEYNQMQIVGVIHSHHEMGAGDEDNPSFSGHDAAFINSNHNLSLLAGRDRETRGFKIVGIARVNTPCGGMMKIKAKVKPMDEAMDDDEQALFEEFTTKVNVDRRSYASGGVSNHQRGNGGNRQYQPQLVHHTHYRQGTGK